MNSAAHKTVGNRVGKGREYLSAFQENDAQKLAWVNSLCLFFLVIGGFGLKLPAVSIKAVPPVEDVIPVVLQPVSLPPPVTAENEAPRDQHEPGQPEATPVVAVTLNTPEINFSIPTIGNLVAATPIAAVPVLAIAQPLVARGSGEGGGRKAEAPAPPSPITVGSTGNGGDRPQPPYPKIALAQGEQGTVVLWLTVDGTGAIISAEVKETSSFPLLDRSTMEFVKRHWRIPSASNERLFEATITYRLSASVR